MGLIESWCTQRRRVPVGRPCWDGKKQHERLTEIALINSHEIRKPVATILGLVQLFKDVKNQNPDRQLLEHLESATKQLDDVIKRIINKTEDL